MEENEPRKENKPVIEIPENALEAPKEAEQARDPEIDLMEWAEEKGVNFDDFSEAVFIMAMILGTEVIKAGEEGKSRNQRRVDKKKNKTPTFRVQRADAEGVIELLVRRVPQKGKIAVQEKQIIVPD